MKMMRRLFMPTYDYRCDDCGEIREVFHGCNDEPSVACEACEGPCRKCFLSAPGVVVPPQHQGAGCKMKYYGIKNIATGEGITKDTNVSQPPGIKVKPLK